MMTEEERDMIDKELCEAGVSLLVFEEETNPDKVLGDFTVVARRRFRCQDCRKLFDEITRRRADRKWLCKVCLHGHVGPTPALENLSQGT